MSLNRRDVLLGGGTIAGAVAGSIASGTGPAFAQTPQLPDKWQREADVVVVGAVEAAIPHLRALVQRNMLYSR